MDFQTAVSTVFSKYATFEGRASRSEYWWFALFGLVASLGLSFVDSWVLGMQSVQPLSSLFSLAILLPSLAVGARRLHDIGRSGWWLLILLVPLIGFLVLLYFFVQRSEGRSNIHGPVPQEAEGHTAPAGA
ncbi:DUF805 domain-containing protein [Anianabacter salinae]|uniref:DUF805 domain-containing protein n=1 Tax=Anianabacter salinae TaxID=2851023 RepID=UPI00225DDBED|nr:DUF805 domain-containing protein [Anianabacter salinae]MBV0910904.1 DUF805 domain-containing protein [Anianabacter salinae]